MQHAQKRSSGGVELRDNRARARARTPRRNSASGLINVTSDWRTKFAVILIATSAETRASDSDRARRSDRRVRDGRAGGRGEGQGEGRGERIN